jgi:outer membrane autotransporter protein
MVINQQGGTITGDILLSSHGDTVNVTGGAIVGNIVGTGASGTVNFAPGAGNTFVYSNAITGVSTVNVNSGTLFDNNSITATSVNVNNGGTLAPGLPGTVGTLAINGSLAFGSAATYLVTVTPSAASNTTVTGTASLGGTVQAVFMPGSYVTKSYDILHAASLAGTTFAGVTSNVPGFGVSLSYTPTDVLLNLTAQLGLAAGAGLSQNQLAVANAINGFFNNGGALPPGFASLFGLTGANLANALTQLSGEAATGAEGTAFQMMSSFLSLMLDPWAGNRGGFGAGGPAPGFAPERAAEFPPDVANAYASVLKAPPASPAYGPRFNVWGAAYGGLNQTRGDPAGVGSHDTTARTGGFAGGVDYRIAPDTLVGFALAGGGASWALAAGLGGGRTDVFQAGLYGSRQFGEAYLSGALAYAANWVSTNRTLTIAGIDNLTASFNAQSFGGRAEAGYRVALAPVTLTPYAAVQAQTFSAPAYGETAASGSPQFALTYGSRNASLVRAELGSWIDRTLTFADGNALFLFGRAAYAHDWQSDPALAATFIGLPTATFVVNGAAPPHDLALLTSGAELRWRNGWSLMGKFDGEFSNRSQTYAGTAKLRYTW